MTAPYLEGAATLARAIRDARAITDSLFGHVGDPFLFSRPVPDRHRLIFYIGHLEAFDWNHIGRYALGEPALDPTFDRLFEAGIDPPPGELPADTPSDWPALEPVLAYRARCRERLDSVMPHASPEILHMALEHRLMHAETLAYLLHNMPYDQKTGPAPYVHSNKGEIPIGSVSFSEGRASLGRPRGSGFGWDNEFEEHHVTVPAFDIDRYKITNRQYLKFVAEGGSPSHFWTHADGQWFWRGMFGLVPLPLDWPVYVTHSQASAYAAWVGESLPSEAQFHRAAYSTPEGARSGNSNFASWDPVPVGDSTTLIGNGWEWTSTVFAPFPGFAPAPNYPGYSQNFFDGNHYVLKGASPRTAECFLRPSFRNWFRPEYPYVYAGFRCIKG